MKAANRKSGTVGDIDLTRNGKPIEAVELKLGTPVSLSHTSEAIQKIKAASVERYYILSTAGVSAEEAEEIASTIERFRKSNGCQIIVNGVHNTLTYYLRLLRTPNDFITNYTDLLKADPDLEYEHRLAWNQLCEEY